MDTKKFACEMLTLASLLSIIPEPLNADDAFVYQTVMVSNQEAPGIPGAIVDDLWGYPAIGDASDVLINARISGAGTNDDNDFVLFSGRKNALSPIFREGDVPTGFADDVFFAGLQNWYMDGGGMTTVNAHLFGPGIGGGNNQAIFTEFAGELQLHVIEGGSAPNAGAGVQFTMIDNQRLGRGGHIAFTPRLAGAGVHAGNDLAVYSQIGGKPSLVAREGDPAPGAGANLGSPAAMRVNGNGEVVFGSTLSNGIAGIFSNAGGMLQARLLTSTQAPGMPLGTIFESFHPVVGFNSAGQISFAATMIDGTGTQSRGIFSDAAGSLQPVALQGMPAPGALPSQFIGDDYSYVYLNGNGESMFRANLTGALVLPSTDTAIFAERHGSLQMVAREGSPAAGTTGANYSTFYSMALNTTGNLAFHSNLTGPLVDETNSSALFMTVDGQPQLVARVGDPFDVNDDPMIEDLKTVSLIRANLSSGGEDGQTVALNNAGQLAFQLDFVDGTAGVFIAMPAFVLGDINGDGVVNLLDVAPFVELLTTGEYLPAADINGDGTVNLLDVGPLVELLSM